MMTDDKIKEKLQQYFIIKGMISIENGLVSCTGNVNLKKDPKIEGLPVKFKKVDGSFDCYNNQLTSLAGAPQSVDGGFYCSSNKLTSLAGAPRYVGKSFHCMYNPLTSLAGAPQYVGEVFYLTYGKNLALLPLLMIKGCKQVLFPIIPYVSYHFDNESLSAILNRYLGTGTRGMLACAEEMIEAGYGSNATL